MKNVTVGQSLQNSFPFSLANKIHTALKITHMNCMNSILCLHSGSNYHMTVLTTKSRRSMQFCVHVKIFFISEINYTKSPENLYALPLEYITSCFIFYFQTPDRAYNF
jgi:hypothetical protein